MLRIKGAKIAATILLDGRPPKWLALCAVFCLLSGSALALIRQKPAVENAAALQAEAIVNVTVSSTGCSPSSVTQSVGEITVKVVNETGKTELPIQFYDGRGVLLRDVIITQGSTQWSESFSLGSGNYRLVADHNPEWACRITVQ